MNDRAVPGATYNRVIPKAWGDSPRALDRADTVSAAAWARATDGDASAAVAASTSGRRSPPAMRRRVEKCMDVPPNEWFVSA